MSNKADVSHQCLFPQHWLIEGVSGSRNRNHSTYFSVEIHIIWVLTKLLQGLKEGTLGWLLRRTPRAPGKTVSARAMGNPEAAPWSAGLKNTSVTQRAEGSLPPHLPHQHCQSGGLNTRTLLLKSPCHHHHARQHRN